MSQIAEKNVDRALQLLKVKPYTPSELGKALGFSREHTYRKIIKPLVTEGKLIQVEGTHAYQTIGQNQDALALKIQIASESELMECTTMQKWFSHAKKKKSELSLFNRFSHWVLSKQMFETVVNPDAWNHPIDTEKAVESLCKHYGVKQLEQMKRQIVRHFLKYGLQIEVSKEEAERLGISGKKDSNGDHATVSFEHGEYQKAKAWYKEEIQKGNLKDSDFAEFLVRFWSFCRPSSCFIIKNQQFRFYSVDLEFCEVDGEEIELSMTLANKKTVTNKALYEICKTSNKYPIKQKTQRRCTIQDVLENKTETNYTKYILDEEAVLFLENFVNARSVRGLSYTFFDDNKTVFTFDNYNKIVEKERLHQGTVFKQLYTFLQIKDDYCFQDSTYALRHIGVQHWLNITNYDYGFVSEMGWKDISTLRNWYGRMTGEAMLHKIASLVVR